MGDGDTVLYGSDDCGECRAAADLLRGMGVDFRFRPVNTDALARSEWEQLDGEQMPLLRKGHHTIVRGLDRIRFQQLFGYVGS